jgi:hypothetical protein
VGVSMSQVAVCLPSEGSVSHSKMVSVSGTSVTGESISKSRFLSSNSSDISKSKNSCSALDGFEGDYFSVLGMNMSNSSLINSSSIAKVDGLTDVLGSSSTDRKSGNSESYA